MKNTKKLINEAEKILSNTRTSMQDICRSLNPYTRNELAVRLANASKLIERSC